MLTELNAAAKTQPPAPVTTAPQPGQLTVKTIPKVPAVPGKIATLPVMAGGAVPTSVARGGLILSATGSNAQGLDVEQLGPDGQPTARCQPPGSDFWFVSPEASKQHTELYLMNADATPADAHVSVQTDSGPLLGAPDSGIVVPPHAMIIQSLDKLRPLGQGGGVSRDHEHRPGGRGHARLQQRDQARHLAASRPAAGHHARC